MNYDKLIRTEEYRWIRVWIAAHRKQSSVDVQATTELESLELVAMASELEQHYGTIIDDTELLGLPNKTLGSVALFVIELRARPAQRSADRGRG